VDDVEVVAQREVLVHDLDAEVVGLRRVGDVGRLALEEHLAGVERVDARDALDESRLAGAVVADECRDLARAGHEVDAAQRVHGTEVLAPAPYLERRRWGQVGCGGRVVCHRPPRRVQGAPSAGLCCLG